MNWYMIHTGHFGYPQPENNPLLLQTFDYENGCTTCGVGKTQYAPVRFRKEPKVTNKAFTGLNWLFGEIFMTNSARGVLEANGITGMTFSRPVIHKNGKPLESWVQMRPETLLPPAINLKNLTAEKCEKPTDQATLEFIEANNPVYLEGPFCGRVKHNPPADSNWISCYELNAAVMTDQPDLVVSHEWFGSGLGANREIFASQRFKDVCDTYKLRGLFFNRANLV